MRALLASVIVVLCGSELLLAQGSARDLEEVKSNVLVDPSLFDGLKYRSLNFSRGGRVTAVAGVPSQPLVYYMGGTGAGVWKTADAGNNWTNVSDGFFGVGSIGAIAVAESDPNVVYVGTGSACPRGNISVGDGVYKSTDAGKTWKHVGLRNAGQIGRIQVHPANPDLVYVAALGYIFGPNVDRGVFRSKDGGKTWEKTLFISDKTGAVDLAMDVKNPRILYAAAWRAERKPWALISGSEDGGVFKSVDGGEKWEKLAGGLPTGLVGKISVTVSPANPERVWALIEAEGERGGVHRSDDAGKSWRRINGDAGLRQRPWYYIHIYADPKDENTVYVLNTQFLKSLDGGRTFPQRITVPHGDNHDLWLNPANPLNMVQGNDGGANVTFDGGQSWSWQRNQPTSEIYRVEVDNQWPYRVYGAQQDNSTISVPSRSAGGFGGGGGGNVWPDWYSVGGCESGHIAVDPRDPDVVYATCYGGNVDYTNRKTGESRSILSYPQLQLGAAPRDLKYRFQWNAPVRLSPHNPDVLYHGSQVLHRTKDRGQTWEVISPDLTTNNKEQQDFTGGPISHDSTGVEVFNTIFAFEESPARAGELWVGSDDGRVHLSKNAGGAWSEITPAALPKGATVNMIDLSRHAPGRAFIAVYRYRENDFKPYIFRTNDYGAKWDLLTDGKNGIPATHFVRVVREDPDRKGLLYAGTEFGMFVSFDDGLHWQKFQLNLPVTPVTDLKVHRKDLVVSTQGRAFWVLDDLTPLHQTSDPVKTEAAWLFEPRAGYRGGNMTGARFNYYFAKAPEGEVVLDVLDASGKVIRTVRGKAGDAAPAAPGGGGGGGGEEGFFGGGPPARLPVKAGLNTLAWNLRIDPPRRPEGVVHWGGTPGMQVVPGSFQVRLTSGTWTQTQPLKIEIHPGIQTTAADFQKQWDLAREITAKIDELFTGLTNVRDVKVQVDAIASRTAKAKMDPGEIAQGAKDLAAKLTKIEEQMTQVKSKSNQDPINFPPMIDNQLTTLYGFVVGEDFQPTAGSYERFADLKAPLAALMAELNQVMTTDLAAFNNVVRRYNVPPVVTAGAPPTSNE